MKSEVDTFLQKQIEKIREVYNELQTTESEPDSIRTTVEKPLDENQETGDATGM